MIPRLSALRIVMASLAAAAGLAVVGWVDYAATRAELVQLLREQAQSLRQTIAAAARSNEAAGALAEAQVGERLLDNARLLAELDRRHLLDAALLERTAEHNRLFRVIVLGPDGRRELGSSGFGRGVGHGGGHGGNPAVQRLLSGERPEFVGQLHSPWWGGGARMAAGVRRAAGGAILLNAEAAEVGALQRQLSLDTLVEDIAASTAQLAYVTLDRPGLHVAHGTLPVARSSSETRAGLASARAAGGLFEHEVTAGGHPVLEFVGPVALGSSAAATLRLGLRLDGLRRAQGRLLVGLVVSLAAALALSLLALGTVWLRQAYSALSEKHRLAEAALRRRDRLSAMGELASTVAHEVRNPLNAIAMSTQRLRREYPVGAAADADREELTQLLGVVEGETQRINTIVQQFLEFARPPRLSLLPLDLGAELQALVDAARPFAASRGVALEADLAGAGTATADGGQLRQAVDNLVRNAIEATPQGGRVAVRARSGSKGHSIEVRDTGAGIEADDLPRIFDLYFTTKPHGTGVGLAVTQQIVAAHGGTIEVDSRPGEGTAMTIRLPLAVEGSASA